MICKECGAYNPDHATFCKVCAASLKGDAASKAQEEEQQPTKRFSRPSWIAPEQSERVEKVVEKPVKAAEELTADLNDVAESADDEPIVEKPAEKETIPEPEEETTVPLWTSSRSRMRPEPTEPDDDEDADDAEDDDADADDEPESIYNDEEALEDEEDPFEYEPTPPKRKQQKKKNNTLFTVLLIAIIVVIVGILVLLGYWLLKKQLNCGSSTDNRGAQQAETQAETPSDTTGEQTAPQTSTLDARTAQLQEMIDDDGSDVIAITVVIPGNSTVTIDFPNQNDYTFENTEAKDITRKVKIPVEVFYPGRPLTESETTIEFQPDITITSADGSSYKVDCPTFTRSFQKLNITVTEPIPEGDEPFMAPTSNIVSIQGTIDNTAAEIYVNDVKIPVYVGGQFMYDYKFADGVSEDTVETITITAQLKDYISDTKEVKLHAYKFIPDPMKLELKSEGSLLRADKSGKLTVTGVTLPGATLTAVSDNSTNVLCGSVNVDAEGNFSLQITTEESFYGMSVITLNAEKEGAESGSTKFTVIKGFADKDAFLKFYNGKHSYLEIPSKISLDVLLANQAQYANNDYGFRITATVVEVITIEGDTIVKMSMNKTNETVYVHNLSDKWTPAENVGTKYNVYGNFIGSYSDTGCCEFYGWFAKVVK